MIEKLISSLGAVRSSLIFYALVAVCAGLYAWGATASADRDRLAAWAQTACAAVGTQFDNTDAAHRALCTGRILATAELNHETDKATAKTLSEAMGEQQQLSAADLAAATKHMESAAAALKKMEQENAKIDGSDRVSGDWFRALNELGGLHE